MSMPEQSPTPLDKMQSAIQLAGFHYIVCLKALPTNADHRLTIEKMEYVFAERIAGHYIPSFNAGQPWSYSEI
jgi:hypothetical protein